MRTLKDLEDAYSFMRDPVIWDAIQMIKERDRYVETLDRYVETLEAALREIKGWNDNQDRRSLKIAAVIDAALAGEKKEQEWD
jgi:CRISPR/Cas system CSM-associated protein Csm2 small subunit